MPLMTQPLRRGWQVGHRRVARILREDRSISANRDDRAGRRVGVVAGERRQRRRLVVFGIEGEGDRAAIDSAAVGGEGRIRSKGAALLHCAGECAGAVNRAVCEGGSGRREAVEGARDRVSGHSDRARVLHVIGLYEVELASLVHQALDLQAARRRRTLPDAAGGPIGNCRRTTVARPAASACGQYDRCKRADR